jgi:Bacterial cadherin-like domain
MMNHQSAFPFRPLAATALACALATPAQAVTYTLVATSFPATMPDGTSGVPMWGYRVSAPNGDLASAQAAPVTSPGAALVVPPGDSTLSVTLVNELRDGTPTSFVVHGLNTAMTPVFADAAGAPCTPATAALPANATPAQEAARRACRFRSFTAEALAGGAAVTYTYNNVRPGTYLYQSGTMPQVQVQMGLYGMMSKDAAAGTVYPGVAYAGQTRVIFSEVDSALHDAVTAQTFSGSTLDYNPNHYRTHVYDPLTHLPLQVAPGAAPQAMGAGQSHLIRIANVGLQTRVPTLSDGTWALLGEDAQPYPYAREQYSALLPAAKTTEAWLGSGRALTLFDRRLGFADAAAGVAGQFVQFAAASTTPTQLSAACPTTGTQGVAWTCSVSSSTPGATLSLVSGPAGLTMNAAGVISWTPTNAQAQRPADQAVTNPVVVAASSASTATTTGSFAVTVANINDAPSAAARSYTSDANRAGRVTVAAAQGLKIGAIDVDGDALAVAGVTGTESAGLVANPADGSFVFTTTNVPAPGSAARTVALQYTLTDVPDTLIKGALPALASAPANLTLTISPNRRPARTATSTTFGSLITPNVVRFTAPASVFSTPNLTSTTYVTDPDGSVNPASMQIAATSASALGTTPVPASCFSSLSGTGGALTGYGTFSLSAGAITFTPSRRSNYLGGLLNLPIRCTAYFQVSDDLNATMATRALVTVWVLAN